ncbi:MAG: helix-turn-helix transcriptional regulator [Lachnospiraceae bacterium]|nr:helix-turn-helix transcriptional regulator [Lachnospiraceae bacterium]
MKINREEINVVMARNKKTVTQLAAEYGVSRSRMNIILNSQIVTPVTAGRLAEVLGVDVTEIIED